jgi:hypothetical protein
MENKMDQNKPNDMPKNPSTTTKLKGFDINKNFLQFMMRVKQYPIDLRPAPGEEENETSDLDAKPRSAKPKSTSRARKVRCGPGSKEKP